MLEVKNIEKSFDKKIIENLSFQVENGEIVFVTGRSGCGKTTLMRMLLGLEKSDCGIIKNNYKKVSAVFQEDRLLENVDIMGNIQLVSKVSQDKLFDDYCKILPRNSFKAPICEYSGGMKRRAAILRAMLCEGEAVFMDEPFKGLDDKSKADTMKYVLDTRNKRTLFIITHDMSEVDFFKPTQIITMELLS